MGWLSTLIGGGDAIKAIGETVDNLFTSDEERKERELEILKTNRDYDYKENQLIAGQNIAQTEVNKVEAASTRLFVAGWRPFIGWCCGFSLLYVAIIEPVARFVAVTFFEYTGQFPVIDTTITMQVLTGMLGLAGMRTYEKSKGAA